MVRHRIQVYVANLKPMSAIAFAIVAALFKATSIASDVALARPFAEALIFPVATALSGHLIVLRISARRVSSEVVVISFGACVSLVLLIPHSIVCHNLPPCC
jgi:hypothetical protein